MIGDVPPPRRSKHTPPGGSNGDKPLRRMDSWIKYGNREIDKSRWHIGNGFLEVGCYVFLIAPSYAGKSTLIAQLSISFAIARCAFIFPVGRPLRSLIVQAEDPENKLIRMGQMSRRMGLTEAQIKQVDENTAVLVIDDLQDTMAIAEIERHAKAFKPDIIWLNPLTSYLSGGAYKEEGINKLLRVDFGPMLVRLGCSGVVAHHPPKPLVNGRDINDMTIFELQYGAAGMASLTNATRGNVFLAHVDGDVFKLVVGKGYEELDVHEKDTWLKRSLDPNGVMLWVPCDGEQAEKATEKNKERRRKTSGKYTAGEFLPYENLLKVMSPTEKYTRGGLIELTKKRVGRGKTWTELAIQQLVFEKKLATTKIKNPAGGPFVLFHIPTPMEPAG